ncbi:ammonium transporter [Sphingomonas sp. KR3-1]|uniref:ammonium transporter n=1 Tax=Sphingomonas sp. KR3-1 TaxID=3156611 RepID=UPI0032B488F6
MNKELAAGLGWCGGILALSIGSVVARKLGYIDQDTVLRLVLGINGLMIAWYGNRIPKKVVPSIRARQAQRVAGWSQVLSGLVYTGLWAFAPIPVATILGTATVFAGVVVTLGYCLSLRDRARTA